MDRVLRVLNEYRSRRSFQICTLRSKGQKEVCTLDRKRQPATTPECTYITDTHVPPNLLRNSLA